MRKEILICDCCRKEADEVKRPIMHKTLMAYHCFFDLCENCYNELKKLDDWYYLEIDKTRDELKNKLKEKHNNIYEMMFGKSEE